jgi:hypothetical protein
MNEHTHTADLAQVERGRLSLVKSDIADIRACQERDGVDHICGDPDRCEELDRRTGQPDLGPLGHEFRAGKFGGDACVFGDFPHLCARAERDHR